jgi:hypothetical protein
MTITPLTNLKKVVGKLPATTEGLDMSILIQPTLKALPTLLSQNNIWHSMYINYEPPFLMRLHTPIESNGRRINVCQHYFFGAPEKDENALTSYNIRNPYTNHPELVGKEEDNNYHPHPWAACFYLFNGKYEQDIGYAHELGYTPIKSQQPMVSQIWQQNSADPDMNTYAFNDRLLWHRVKPLNDEPVSTLMITYKPEDWQQIGPKPPELQRGLYENELGFMFDHFTKQISKHAL